MRIKEIKELKKKQSRENCGFGFVAFVSNLQVKRVTDASQFKYLCMNKLTPEQRASTKVLKWKVSRAPASSDIIWENMQNDEFYSEVKSWLLLFILFLVCVVFVTPLTLVDELQPIINFINDSVGKDSFLANGITAFITPLLVLAFNSGILPLFIDFISYLEGHKNKSKRQIGIMRKNFFFQSFNIIFLQLTG